jgi:hypothetical protein
MSPEMMVMGKTLARVISSQRETVSIALSEDRFCVRRISPQFWIVLAMEGPFCQGAPGPRRR